MELPPFKGTVVCGLTSDGVQPGPKFRSKSEAEKRASNDHRLKVLRDRFSSSKRQKQFITNALNNVDIVNTSLPNKKIKFDDDIDTKEDKGAKVNSIPTQNGSASKKILFEDSDSGEDTLPSFDSKPQYSGKSGAKLMALEARFGGDKRFQMNEKFLDEPDKSDSDSNSEKPANVRKKEKTKEINILEKVLGKNLNTTDQTSPSKQKQKFGHLVRFDPTNPEHYKYDISKKVEVVKGESSDSETSADEKETETKVKVSTKKEHETPEKAPKVSEKRFFEVDADFAANLRKKLTQEESNDQSFSLLAAFGRKEEIKKEPVVPSGPTKIKKNNLQKWQIDLVDQKNYDSSSGEEEITDKNISAITDTTATKKVEGLFLFLRSDDKRLNEAVEKFRRIQSKEKIKRQWEKYRPSLIKNFKARRKEAVRSLKRKKQAEWSGKETKSG